MLTWITAVAVPTRSFLAVLVSLRAHLLAIYLWRETGDLRVLAEVARFERRVQWTQARARFVRRGSWSGSTCSGCSTKGCEPQAADQHFAG